MDYLKPHFTKLSSLIIQYKQSPHRQNNFGIQSVNRRNRDKIDMPNIHIHKRSLVWFGAYTFMTSSSSKLNVWPKTSSLRKMMLLRKCIPHATKNQQSHIT